jgi:hypothetical protein
MKSILALTLLLVLNVIIIEAASVSYQSGTSAQLQMKGMLRCYAPLINDPRATQEIHLIVSEHAYSFVA